MLKLENNPLEKKYGYRWLIISEFEHEVRIRDDVDYDGISSRLWLDDQGYKPDEDYATYTRFTYTGFCFKSKELAFEFAMANL